jgi:hypothetical protein
VGSGNVDGSISLRSTLSTTLILAAYLVNGLHNGVTYV